MSASNKIRLANSEHQPALAAIFAASDAMRGAECALNHARNAILTGWRALPGGAVLNFHHERGGSGE